MRAVLTLDGLSISEPMLRAAKKRLTARALQIQDQAATALEQLSASAAPSYPTSLSAADGVDKVPEIVISGVKAPDIFTLPPASVTLSTSPAPATAVQVADEGETTKQSVDEGKVQVVLVLREAEQRFCGKCGVAMESSSTQTD